jgi:hypothetical protein
MSFGTSALTVANEPRAVMTGSRETVRCLGAMCVLDTWPVARQEFPDEFLPTRGREQAEGYVTQAFRLKAL